MTLKSQIIKMGRFLSEDIWQHTPENPKLILICVSQKYGKRNNQIKFIFQQVKLKTFEAV